MVIRLFSSLLLVFACFISNAQAVSKPTKAAAQHWSDSVYKTLSNTERIAQLMVVRLSTIDGKTKKVTFFEEEVSKLIQQYNIGGICLFQGSPTEQALAMNRLQAKAKTPIMMCIDAEWGVGMRMTDSVLPLPKQMMLGAMQDQNIVYEYGRLVGEQCKRIGIHVNYAPVVDVNNNPMNPVINDRSFGEDKYKVANYGIAYMRGMQDVGVMACAKHFPGHGDVAVDSHYDLPVINKSLVELDSLELYPFRKIFEAGVGSVMIAHLYIPAIDNTANRATSLSPQNINVLLRQNIGYNGLTFTDALEMQGVRKFFPDGEAAVQSIIAGNDMLCLPGDVPLAISKITQAIAAGSISWQDIEMHCKKVLMAKYEYGLGAYTPINVKNITADLNDGISAMRKKVAENAITLLKKSNDQFFPLSPFEFNKKGDVAFVALGINEHNALAKRMKEDYNADVFMTDSLIKSSADITAFVQNLKATYKNVVIGVHNMGRSSATNFGITEQEIALVSQLQQQTNSIIFQFGNAYAAKNWCDASNLVVCYEDDAVVQGVAADMLQGKSNYKGVLPVTVCAEMEFGMGLAHGLKKNSSQQWKMDVATTQKIDSIANDAIANQATPGCVVLVVKDGAIAFQKAYGNYTYSKEQPMQTGSVFDMASVTKICATTIAVMKLFDEGKLDLNKTLGYYLASVRGTNKADLGIDQILLHQAGMVPYIPFYKETIDSSGNFLPGIYNIKPDEIFSVPVAQNLYMHKGWLDSIEQKIIRSAVVPSGKYVYSDNDFIYLAKIVESVSGLSIDDYVQKHFYGRMGLSAVGFLPLQKHALKKVVPSEDDQLFRKQLLQGYVHDQGTAMMGGVAGHAGLFSDAYDIAAIMQMLLNGGVYNGHRYLSEATVQLFTKYQSDTSRRGYGFDKPEKDNASRKDPYPTLSASPATFGHTGFTGTCTWADPTQNLVYVFLSNRVHPSVSNTLLRMNVRLKIHETIYEALKL
jgi:beta-glucosidase-like glycosyl hydrolase/CubicO group peptidase (beta-lactamase class C family)